MGKRGVLIIFVTFFLLSNIVYAPPPSADTLPSAPNIAGSSGNNLDITSSETCNDGIKNQNETDIDCGSRCNFCQTGKNCSINRDCLTNYCDPNKKCRVIVATCNDGIKNGYETNIDCGGRCNPCISGVATRQYPKTQQNFEQTQGKIYSEEDVRRITEMLTPKSDKLSSIYLGISFFFIIILSSSILYNNIQIKKLKTKVSDPYFEKIKVYIINNLGKGYSSTQIRQSLLRHNYPIEKVDEAFQLLKIL